MSPSCTRDVRKISFDKFYRHLQGVILTRRKELKRKESRERHTHTLLCTSKTYILQGEKNCSTLDKIELDTLVYFEMFWRRGKLWRSFGGGEQIKAMHATVFVCSCL